MVKTLRDSKGQFAGSVGMGKNKIPAIASTKLAPRANSGYEDIAENQSAEQYLNELDQIRSGKSRLKPTEKSTLHLGYSLAFAYPKLITIGIDETPLIPSNIPFKDLRSKLSGLHFAKESLSDFERDVLRVSESMLKKIDARNK